MLWLSVRLSVRLSQAATERKTAVLSMNLELHTAQGLIGSHGERKARGYNEGLGPSPQRSSRGRAPVGASGASLPEAEGLSAFCVSKESRKFAP